MLFRLSETAANLIFTLGNLSLIVGAVFVLLGSILVPWSAGERDRYANEQIAEARKVGSLADAKAGQANERAATLELEAQQAKLETEKLKARTAWRSLTPAQRSIIVGGLSDHHGRATIAHTDGDAEAGYFCVQLVTAFMEAGWVVQIRSVTLNGNVLMGMQISESTDPNTKLVSDVLTKAGFPPFSSSLPATVSANEPGGMSKADIVIFVGAKTAIEP